MPGVANALHLGASILERKEGMWRAFEAAGVQSSLGGEAVSAPFDEAEDTDDRPSASDRPIQEGGPHSRAGMRPPRGGADESEEDRTRSHAGAVGARDSEQYEPASAGDPGMTGRDARAACSSGDRGTSSRSKPGRRSRLRSYVLPDSDVEPESTGRSPVDDAGILDVDSISPAGALLRHIEVKSTDGPWDEMGVGLSPRQLEFARKHPETFWLYVVEYATDETGAQVFGIPDVANKIEEYRLDRGWATVAEQMYS